jgi:amidase/aspartyl-tRNA(Asn)/glutamyl-tRNA(Gln) amidotransferase subunit A
MKTREDLISTLQAIAGGLTTRQEVLQNCIDKAHSSACEHVFLSLLAEFPNTLKGTLRVPGALAGLPFSAKDLFDVQGETTSAGSIVLKNQPAATRDCPAVANMRAAGGMLIGRTNMVEFAFSGVGINPHYGTPAAWDAVSNQFAGLPTPASAAPFEPLVPGGSSSGAAVSVATGAAFIGLGSDTGGSIRIPAALNGIVGFKNTARRVSTQGAVPLSTTMDTICAMTRSVRDGILAHEILAQRKVPLFKMGLADYKIAIPTTLMLEALSSTVRQAWERSLHQLTQAGARLTEIKLPEISDLSGLLATGGFSAAESFTWHRHLLAKNAADYDPRVAQRIERGVNMSAFEYLELQQGRAAWIQRMQLAMRGYDVMLSPTVPVTSPTIASMAPGVERDEAFFKANALLLRNTSVVNMLDGCALSLPCHHAGELPVSLMVWQGPMADDAVLNVSLAIEHHLKMNA